MGAVGRPWSFPLLFPSFSSWIELASGFGCPFCCVCPFCAFVFVASALHCFGLEHCPKARTPNHGMPWNGRAQRSRRGSASMTTVFGCVSCSRKLHHRNSQMRHHLPSSCMAMVSIAHCIYDCFVSTSIWQETTLSNLGWSNPITSWSTFWNLCIGLHWSALSEGPNSQTWHAMEWSCPAIKAWKCKHDDCFWLRFLSQKTRPSELPNAPPPWPGTSNDSREILCCRTVLGEKPNSSNPLIYTSKSNASAWDYYLNIRVRLKEASSK